ncbi:MAG: hypothetical protein CMJ75_18595 [Planctomycetaceae bacterium]|nr:hypothetical protein [Planctomycetaceae bacterium]
MGDEEKAFQRELLQTIKDMSGDLALSKATVDRLVEDIEKADLQKLRTDVARIVKLMDPNGKPGLEVRLDRLEQRDEKEMNWNKWFRRIAAGLILAILGERGVDRVLPDLPPEVIEQLKEIE